MTMMNNFLEENMKIKKRLENPVPELRKILTRGDQLNEEERKKLFYGV